MPIPSGESYTSFNILNEILFKGEPGRPRMFSKSLSIFLMKFLDRNTREHKNEDSNLSIFLMKFDCRILPYLLATNNQDFQYS